MRNKIYGRIDFLLYKVIPIEHKTIYEKSGCAKFKYKEDSYDQL